MIDVEFETPAEVDKLANFTIAKILGTKEKIRYLAFLFENPKIWAALKRKVEEGVNVTIIAPPITSYSGDGFDKVYRIYSEAATFAEKKENFDFYVCPLWWQKDPEIRYSRSLLRIAYALHIKLLVIDRAIYLPSSNFESARHYDICLWLDSDEYVNECEQFIDDLKSYCINIVDTDFSTKVNMIKEAILMTLRSEVKEQKMYPFSKLLFLAPFYRYQPNNLVRLKINDLLESSDKYIYIMFQHFMPDVSNWSEPKSPCIMETLISKWREGVDVRLLAAGGVVNPKAVRAESAPILKPLYESKRIKRSQKVHAKFICTDRGFLVGSMNMNPTSLFHSYFPSKRKIRISDTLHILLDDAIPEEYVAKKYGIIWELPGYKSNVEVLLINEWNAENQHLQGKLRDFFNRCWLGIKA